jgi:hypothetical protein
MVNADNMKLLVPSYIMNEKDLQIVILKIKKWTLI